MGPVLKKNLSPFMFFLLRIICCITATPMFPGVQEPLKETETGKEFSLHQPKKSGSYDRVLLIHPKKYRNGHPVSSNGGESVDQVLFNLLGV